MSSRVSQPWVASRPPPGLRSRRISLIAEAFPEHLRENGAILPGK